MVNFIANNGTQILFKKARECVEQINTRKTKKTEIMSAISRTLTIFMYNKALEDKKISDQNLKDAMDAYNDRLLLYPIRKLMQMLLNLNTITHAIIFKH